MDSSRAVEYNLILQISPDVQPSHLKILFYYF